jgi:hypothetical protein
MDSPEFQPATLTLLEQQSTDADKACTAYSAANLVKLMGYHVSDSQFGKIKNEAMAETPSGLKPPQLQRFFEEFGINYKYLGNDLSSYAHDKNELLEKLIHNLKSAPVSFSISSARSMFQDSNVPGKISDTGKPGVYHQVVAALNNDAIRIVDPYLPNTKLYSYKINNMSSMENLLTLLTSHGSQHFLQQERKPLTREIVRQESLRRLHSPNFSNFITFSLSGNNLYTATRN